MTRNITGFDRIPKELKWLEPTILKWTKINCDYADVAEGSDALYWYNERANIGSLAGAAWKANIFAVEEYAAFKRPTSVTSKRSGRIDLYLNDGSHDAVIEGKICWVAPGTRPQALSQKMSAAVKDARRDKEGDQKIGAVFYVMRIKKESAAEEKTLRAEVGRVRDFESGCVGLVFPESHAGPQVREA